MTARNGRVKTVKLMAAAFVLLLATSASAGSLWVQPYGSYGTYAMGDLNRAVADYNSNFGASLDKMNAGPAYGIAFGRDFEHKAGSIGFALERLDGSSSLSHGDYSIDVNVPAYVVRLFLKGDAPWLETETFTLAVGGSLGIISTNSDVNWRYYHVEPGDPEPTITDISESGDFSSSGAYFDWFVSGEKRLGERLVAVLDLGIRANTLSSKQLEGDAIGGRYSSDYAGLLARLGLRYKFGR